MQFHFSGNSNFLTYPDDRVQLFPILNEDGSYAQIDNPGGHDPRAWAISLNDIAFRVCNDLIAIQADKNSQEGVQGQEQDIVGADLGSEVKFVNEPASGQPGRWDSVLNCHSFATRFVAALSLGWPKTLDHSGNHQGWLVDTILTLQFVKMSIKEK